MKLFTENSLSIISLPKEVLGGVQVIEFSNLVDEVISNSPDKLIIDLTDVQVINSSGLGMIVGAHTSCMKKSCKMIVVASNPKVLELFQITNLTQILSIENSLQSAKLKD